MATIRESITVPVTAAEAFGYTADFSNAARWDPGVESSRRTDEGPIGVGSRFELEVSFGGRSVPMVYTITEFDPPGRVVLVGEAAGLTATDTVTFTEAGGATTIDYTAELEFRNFIRLVAPFMGRAFDNIGRKAMAGLAAALRSLR